MTKAVRLAFDTIDHKIQALKNTPAGRDWKDQFGDVIDEFTVAGKMHNSTYQLRFTF